MCSKRLVDSGNCPKARAAAKAAIAKAKSENRKYNTETKEIIINDKKYVRIDG